MRHNCKSLDFSRCYSSPLHSCVHSSISVHVCLCYVWGRCYAYKFIIFELAFAFWMCTLFVSLIQSFTLNYLIFLQLCFFCIFDEYILQVWHELLQHGVQCSLYLMRYCTIYKSPLLSLLSILLWTGIFQ